ncbi:MAG TPA: RNA polymerase subunit sigma-24, partial [Clostridiaceae bacterium]|nr:RNA polymerase subunit sigma-24 [Clostridiaceae bacterium]
MNWFKKEHGFSKEAFITLVEQERERLYRVAYGYLKNESLALEALD